MSTPAPPGSYSPRPGRADAGVTRLLITAVALAVFAASMWFAWLGWDHTYDEVDGVADGPYQSWQVIGCAVSIAAATVLAYRHAPGGLAIAVLAIAADAGFAIPWGVDASDDETGLWVVGLLLLVLGSGVALSSVLTVTHVLRRPESSPVHIVVLCSALTLLALAVYAPVAVVPLVVGGWVFLFRWLPAHRRPRNGQAN